MKLLFINIILFPTWILSILYGNNAVFGFKNDQILDDLFQKFILDFGKDYKPFSDEYFNRFSVFKNNLKRLSKFVSVKENGGMNFGITKFFDLTPEEFKEKYLTTIKSFNATPAKKISQELAKNKVDWRTENVVTPVKDQKNCGACWAFTFSELVESMTAISGGQLMVLSPQQVLDCTNSLFSCSIGGNHCIAASTFQNLEKEVVLDSVYPYVAKKSSSCKEPFSSQGASVTSNNCEKYVGNEDSMLEKLSNSGPLAVAVDATMWQFYSGGVIQYHCGTNLNHAVVIVGYDLTEPVPYYIVRNSWGKEFGHEGYLYLAIHSNVCGLAENVLDLTAKQI